MNFEAGSEIITRRSRSPRQVTPLVKKGWLPAFIDVAEGTYNLDADKVEK